MESQTTEVKVRKTRVRKEQAPAVSALKKSVSLALKAAWHVDQVKTRLEKAKRERNTLEKKVQAQRAALLEVKEAVEVLLAELGPITPELPITPVEADVVPQEPETVLDSVVLDPSAAA